MDFKQIQNQTLPIFREFGIKKAALFGSYARGDFNAKSDIDMLVELNKPISLFKFIELKHLLQDSLGKKIDLIQYKQIKPSLKDYILKDEQVLYQA